MNNPALSCYINLLSYYGISLSIVLILRYLPSLISVRVPREKEKNSRQQRLSKSFSNLPVVLVGVNLNSGFCEQSASLSFLLASRLPSVALAAIRVLSV
jgi:hypothetical protein